VTNNGTNHAAVTDVSFSGANTSAITPVSATSIKVQVPAGATTGKISVTNRAGSGLSMAIFKVTPKITDFTPTSGLIGESVTINGFNLQVGTTNPTVKFGTALAPPASAATPTSVTVTIPPTATTGKLSVMTTDGTGISTTDFIVIKQPTIATFSPTTGMVGTLVTINGTNLSSVTDVTFNGTSAGPITVVSATSIRVNVPTGATTGKISVSNRAGSAQSMGLFTVP
jgi:hypothetical protein